MSMYDKKKKGEAFFRKRTERIWDTMILGTYRALSYATYPFLKVFLAWRRYKGKEDAVRGLERLGLYTKERPTGRLIWIHGASVGECLSHMPLIETLVKRGHQVMVTSGTVTSAAMMEKRLPKGAFHQYVPVDYPVYVRRFFKHFHPDVGFFIESDFWPNILQEARRQGIPLVLLNGRISDKSFRRWKRVRWFIRPLLSCFSLTLGQTEEDARRLTVLGSPKAACVGNIKFAAVPPPIDEDELVAMRNAIGDRPAWVAGSTHSNEEEQIGEMHIRLKAKYPSLLTVLVPRHPNRCDEIERQLIKKGLTVHRRSRGEDVNADIYLGDTMGEMGLFYRLAPLVFVGGSLVSFGGQNMLEPMRTGACTLIGPYAFNFREIVERAKKAGGLIEVPDIHGLEVSLDVLMNKHSDRQQISEKGRTFASGETAVLDRVITVLKPWIDA